MGLTTQEKAIIREMICNRFGQQRDERGMMRAIRKPVTPKVLEEFANKTDEEARAEITLYLAQKKKYLKAQQEAKNKELTEINTELENIGE